MISDKFMDNSILSLLKKYDVPTPRYTSYPTVPYWDFSSIDQSKWKQSVINTFNSEKGELCIYIHLPFCENLCTFCACNKRITKNHTVEDPYIRSVLKEWQIYRSFLPALPVIKEIHLGGGTLSKSNPNKTYLNFRNGLSLIFRHLGTSELLWKLPFRLGLDWCALLYFLFSGSGKDAMAVAKAHLHFFTGLPKEYRKRKALNGPFHDQKAGPIYRRMIVIDYFLLGRKVFKDLRI